MPTFYILYTQIFLLYNFRARKFRSTAYIRYFDTSDT